MTIARRSLLGGLAASAALTGVVAAADEALPRPGAARNGRSSRAAMS